MDLMRKGMEKTYKRLFHINERISQLVGQEPAIPGQIWELIEDGYLHRYMFQEGGSKEPENLSAEDIRAICGSVKVPKLYQEQFRSKKFKKNPLKDLNRFAEKWITIRAKLGGPRPLSFHPNTFERIRQDFQALERPFEILRHKPHCDGKSPSTCHKTMGCRHNMLHYNYVFRQCAHRLDPSLEERLSPLLPQLKTKKKLAELDALCRVMFEYNDWPFRPLTPVIFPERRRRRKGRGGVLAGIAKKVHKGSRGGIDKLT